MQGRKLIPKYSLQFFSYVTDSMDEAQTRLMFERAYRESPKDAVVAMVHKGLSGHPRSFSIAMDYLPEKLSKAFAVHHFTRCPSNILHLARHNNKKFGSLVAALFARQLLFNIYYLCHGKSPSHPLFEGMKLNLDCEKEIPSERCLDDREWAAVSLIIKYINYFDSLSGLLLQCNKDGIKERITGLNVDKIQIGDKMTRASYRKWCSFIRSYKKKEAKKEPKNNCVGLFTTIISWDTAGWAKDLAYKLNESRNVSTLSLSENIRRHGKKKNVSIVVLTEKDPDVKQISKIYGNGTLCKIIFINLYDQDNYFSRSTYNLKDGEIINKNHGPSPSICSVIKSCSPYFRDSFIQMLTFTIKPWELYTLESLSFNSGDYFRIMDESYKVSSSRKSAVKI